MHADPSGFLRLYKEQREGWVPDGSQVLEAGSVSSVLGLCALPFSTVDWVEEGTSSRGLWPEQKNKSRVQAGRILTDAASSPIAPRFEFVKTGHNYWEQPRHLRAFQCYWLRSSRSFFSRLTFFEALFCPPSLAPHPDSTAFSLPARQTEPWPLHSFLPTFLHSRPRGP